MSKTAFLSFHKTPKISTNTHKLQDPSSGGEQSSNLFSMFSFSPSKSSPTKAEKLAKVEEKTGEIYSRVDHSTLSSSGTAESTHIHFEWTLDFGLKTIAGKAQHTIFLRDTCNSVSFDSSCLTITDVQIENELAEFIMAEKHKVLGTRVTVILPEKYRAKGKKFNITFVYSTSPEASAVQWLDPSATHGKKHPYVFTQCQAIHARSLLPCMDTPGVKSTYSAKVHAPEWATVLMSAIAEPAEPSDPPKGCFCFAQHVPTPAYLIALVAGDLSSRDISHRVRVWAEPGVVDAAADDFSQTEDFLTAAEELAGPYVWKRYDVLCCPPSFPYGGMENPGEQKCFYNWGVQGLSPPLANLHPHFPSFPSFSPQP